MQSDKDRLNAIALQVRRLCGLPFWPADQGAELVAALSEATLSLEHVRAVIDTCLASCERCPVPADLRRIAAEQRLEFETKPACPVCGGSRWIDGGTVNGYDVARECPRCAA